MPRNLILIALLCAATFCAAASDSSRSAEQKTVSPGSINSISVASWTFLAELAPSANEDALQFGQSVSVSGNVAVVGSPGDSGSTGAAYVFVKSTGGPAKVFQTARLTASDAQFNDEFGYSVSISGSTVIVGAPSASGGPGKAYIFVKPLTGWIDMTETAQLSASDGQANDQFGFSASISGSTVVVGSCNHAVGSNSLQGAAYVFVQPTGGWINMTQTAELTASDGIVNGRFGYSVAISGDTVVAGEYNNSVINGAYVFAMPVSGWVNETETAKLTDPKDTGVGFSVAISGNTIVAGSPSGGPHGAGAAHVYVRQGSTWETTSENSTLRPSEANNGEQFGYAVATTGNTVIAGAPSQFDTGTAYTFVKPVSGWKSTTQTQELAPSDGKSAGRYGGSVAASGPAVIVGANGTNTAYVYRYAANTGLTAFSVPGSTSTYAFGINKQGQIVGQYSNSSGCSQCGYMDSNGTFTAVAYPGATATVASGINDAGEIAGWYVDSLAVAHGFTEINGVYTSVDYPGGAPTVVDGINSLGDVVGLYSDSSGNAHGFLDSGGVFTDIDVPGAQDTVPNGVNDAGIIVGNYCAPPCTTGALGFVYNNSSFTSVSFPGATTTGIYGINTNGDLAGEYGGPGSGGAFVFWSRSRQFVSFNLGDTSSMAYGINISGEVIGTFERAGTLYGFYGHLPGH